MKVIYGTLFLVLFLTQGLFAQEIVTLDSLMNEALQNNPEIKAAKARWEASSKRPTQEGTLPDPMIGVDWQNVTFDSITLDEAENSMLKFSFEQEIPFPGKLSLKKKIAARDSEAEEKSYRAAERKVIADLKVAYYDWYLAGKAIEITERNQELLRKFTKIAEVKYEVGKGIQQDVLRAQVENSKFIEQLEVLRQKKEIIEAKIKSILNRPQDSPLGSPGDIEKTPLTLTSEEMSELTSENAPLLAMKERQIAREEEALKLAQKELYPDFFVGASPGIMGRAGNGVDGIWEVSLGLRVPLYFWSKQKPGIEQAALELKGAQEEYNSVNQGLSFNVKENYLNARTAEKLMSLYQKGIIPQTRLSLESAISGYQVGTVDFLTLLDNLVTLFSFELEYHKQFAEYEKAVAGIEELSGIDITKQDGRKGE
ncbi:MAG TPA: TolC family protein [Thermodesulfobacteriota bacterium]|nr:TolC family protein [Thermodesulfobacteriota bacterium]